MINEPSLVMYATSESQVCVMLKLAYYLTENFKIQNTPLSDC